MEKRTEEFVNATEKFINCCGVDKLGAAKGWARMHRYLVNEMFGVCIRFIGILAKNYEDGIYDARNEYACAQSKRIVDALKKEEWWLDSWIDEDQQM